MEEKRQPRFPIRERTPYLKGLFQDWHLRKNGHIMANDISVRPKNGIAKNIQTYCHFKELL